MEIVKDGYFSTRSFDMGHVQTLAADLIEKKRKIINNLVSYLIEEDEPDPKIMKQIFEDLEWIEGDMFQIMQEVTEDPYWDDEP